MDQLPFGEQPEETLGIVKMDPKQQSLFEHFPEVWESNLSLLTGQKHCDVTFLVGPDKKEMKCHKLLLSARSPVFDAMFLERWEGTATISLENVEPETFQLFLEFVYGNKFTDSIAQAIKLLQLGDKYDVKPLVEKCEELMSKDVKLEDAIQTFVVARSYSLEKLMEHAGDLMTSEFLQLSKEASFRDLDEETLIYLLKKDDLPVVECELFTTVLRWASDRVGKSPDKETSYAEVLKNVLPLIRFPLMTAQEFVTTVFPTQILSQKDVINLFLYFNSDESVRDDVAQRIQYSVIPRKSGVVVNFYEPADSSTVASMVYHSSYEALKYYSGQEAKLEFIFRRSKVTKSKIGNGKVKLCSLLLQGLNYDSLRSYWPSGRTPCTETEVYVSLETIKNGTAEQIFTGKCLLRKGVESELKVQPSVALVDGSKYLIRVNFLGETLVIRALGSRSQRNLDYDMLTSSKLKTIASEVTSVVLFEVNGLQMILPPSENGYTPENGYPQRGYCYQGPLGLHVVRGMKLNATMN